MRDNKDWMMDVLLGHGLKRKEVREQIGKAVGSCSNADMKAES